MFKGRQYEHQVMKVVNQYFSEKMIPLIEIIRDHYTRTDFATDPVSGEFLKKRVGKRMQRYRVEPTENDRDTLQYYNGLINSKKAFIDYFRFTTEVYGRRIKPSALKLPLKINQNENIYLERLLEIEHYHNLIPVLSIKNGFFPQEYELANLIAKLQDRNTQIAVRLDDAAFETFFSEIYPALRNEDYIMYDINEQNVNSKVMELEEFNRANTLAHKIVLNSPRKRDISNSDYENRQYTSLIDNSARDINTEFPNIIGFGDYCGMKDTLPSSAPIIYGTALALFYQYSNNMFMAYVNPNSKESFRGYSHIIPQVLEDANILDPIGACPAIEGVRELASCNESGIWGHWNKFNMIRYLTQMYENM